MADGLTFPVVSAEIAAYYGKRLRYRARRALNQGVGLFLLGVVAIVSAGLVYREALSQSEMATAGMWRYFNAPQLISDKDQRAVLSGILASGVHGKMRLESAGCEEGDEACSHGELLLERAQRVAAVLGGSEVPTADDIVEALSARGPSPPQAGAIADRLLRYLERSRVSVTGGSTTQSSFDPSWQACEEPVDEKQLATERRRLFDLKPALCHDDPGWITKGLVPEPSANENPGAARRDRAMRHSAALEAAVAADSSLLQTPVTASRDIPPLFRLVQAYYISVDSVLRIWQRNSRSGNFNLPKARLWAARPYFTHFLEESDIAAEPHTSPPYLDLGGNGVVQTRCRQVLDGPDPADSGATRKRISGIVCFDLALTAPALRVLAENLARAPLIDVTIFCGVGQKFAYGLCSADSTSPSSEGDEADQRIRKLFTSINSKPGLFESVVNKSTVSDTVSDGETWYLLPVSKDGQGTTTFAIRPTVERTTGLFSKQLLLGMLLGVALILISVAAWQSNALSRSEERLALLRTLPTAAIETDMDDKLIGSNDRAEELLRIPLQRFGLQGGAVPDAGAVFDMENLRCKDNAETKLNVKSIARDRTEGRTTEYFACLRPPYARSNPSVDWFLIHACPVLAPARTKDRWLRAELRATFGTVTRVTDDAILAKLKEKAK